MVSKQKKIKKLLNQTVYSPKRKAKSFLSFSPRKKRNFLSEFLNISQFSKLQKKAEKQIKKGLIS